MNTPVNFELAKLLKEKGFDERCRFYWSSDTNEVEEFQYYHSDRKYSDYTGYPEDVLYFIPTIAEVVMWLYDKHDIWIYPYCAGNNKFHWGIANSKTGVIIKNSYKKDKNTLFEGFNLPTETYEAAIEYTLNNLI